MVFSCTKLTVKQEVKVSATSRSCLFDYIIFISQIEVKAPVVSVIDNTETPKAASGSMNWEGLLESFGRITTESNSTDGSLEDIAIVNPLPNNGVDIAELLFDNATDTVKFELPRAPLSDYDLNDLQATLSDLTKKCESWVEVGDNATTMVDLPIAPTTEAQDPKIEVKSNAMELALANEIEVQSPWVDVSALAASIRDAPVSIEEKIPESICTLATFVPTHMQSYIDLSEMPSANVSQTFGLDNPTILDVTAKVFNDSEVVTNLGPDMSRLETDIDVFLKQSMSSGSLNTPPPSRVQQNIEINPADLVLFNTDTALEDTLQFDNEPASNLYVVRTENVFGKRHERNRVEQLAADAGICECPKCQCTPSDGECRSCDQQKSCSDDKCSCVDCKCDHAEMKCAVGCGKATDSNHNTFLHYHRRHNNSSLEELGVYTLHECDENAPSVNIERLLCTCSVEGCCGNGCGSIRSGGSGCGSSSGAGGGCDESEIGGSACDSGGCTGKQCGGSSGKSCCVTICFKKLDAFKQFLADNDLVHALKLHNLNLTGL